MSEFVEETTQDLIGSGLNWATFCAVYTGLQPAIHIHEAGTHKIHGTLKEIEFPRAVSLSYSGAHGIEHQWNPSGDWEYGGPLMDRFEVEILRAGKSVHAKLYGKTGAAAQGETALVAMCRAIVTSVYGDTMRIPMELLP